MPPALVAFAQPFYDAGTAIVGDHRTVTVTLSEVNGGTDATGVSYAITAPFAVVASTCGATIPAGTSCALTIGFTALTVGSVSAALTVGYLPRTTAAATTVSTVLGGIGAPPPPLTVRGYWLSYHTNQYEEDLGQGSLYQYSVTGAFSEPSVIYSPSGQLPYTPTDPIYGGAYSGTRFIAPALPSYILQYGPVGSAGYNTAALAAQRLYASSYLRLGSTGGTDPRLAHTPCDVVLSESTQPVDLARGRSAYTGQLIAAIPFASCTDLSLAGGSARTLPVTDLFRTGADGRSPFLDALCAGRVGTFSAPVQLTATVADPTSASYLYQYAPPPERAWGYNGLIWVTAQCMR